MKKQKKLINTVIVIALLITAMVFSSCFMSGLSSNMISPEIRALGLPALSDIESVTLKVSGPDMDTIEVSYSQLPSIINIAIPEGNDRTFELSVNTGSTYTGVAKSYKGSSKANLNIDGAIVTLKMGVGSTKLVVPDAYNYRIVQINDISGSGWKTRTWTDMGFVNNYDFIPYDIDIDQTGSIYIANSASSGAYAGIYVIDSFNFSSTVPLQPSYYANIEGNADISAVAIDNKNNRIYGLAWGGVYYWDAPGDYTAQVFVSGNVKGLAVDIDGNLFVSGSIFTTSSFPWIGKFSSTGVELDTYIGSVANETINDITLLEGELFATKSNGVAQIDKFDLDLNLIDSFGTSGSEGTESEFVGPKNFVAVLNKKLTIIDGTDFAAQLVSIDNFTVPNWDTFGSWDSLGNEDGLFKFYSSC